MRHISFDESTVLNELAKIAHKNGLVKTAQDIPAPRGEITGVPESKPAPNVPRAVDARVQLGMFNRFLKSYPSMSAIYNGQRLKVNQLVSDTKQLDFSNQYKTLRDPRVVTDPNVKKMVESLRAKLGQQLVNLRQMINRLPPERRETWVKNIQHLRSLADKQGDIEKSAEDRKTEEWLAGVVSDIQQAGRNASVLKPMYSGAAKYMAGLTTKVPVEELKKFVFNTALKDKKQLGWLPAEVQKAIVGAMNKRSSIKNDGFIVVNAKEDSDKYYDVTDETGEQLVEKAHPGGGTKTELTHSKTDENLVETIVEQQEKDIDVAKSVPKGTYAELMSLYRTLKKMGHKEHLVELRKIIKSVATTDEVIDYTLTSLADKLENMGFKKSADNVNELKKKVAQSSAALQFKQDVLYNLEKIDVDRFKNIYKQRAIKEWRQRSMPTLNEAVSAANDLANKWNKALPEISSVVQPTVRRYFPQLKYERKLTELKRTRPVGGLAGSVEEELPQLEPIPAKKKYPHGPKIREFQKWFNNAIKDTAYEKVGDTLKVDGIYGPNTKYADHLVRSYGGKEKFESVMKKQKPKTKEIETAKPTEPLKKTYSVEEIYKAMASMYNKILRNPQRRLRFPSLGASADIRNYLIGFSQNIAGKELSPEDLRKTIFSQIGQMGRSGPEEVSAAGKQMQI